MDELELEQLRKNPCWVAVLERYQQQSAIFREQQTDFDGWVPRFHELPEINTADLPAIHGKLIAFGFLKFDVAGRDAGIRYQLTPLGKQGISAPTPTDADPSHEGFSVVGVEPFDAVRARN
jgi:hypothetical protein